MNENKLSPDDPRLTAFALGELEGAELAAVEAALRDNAEARAAVEQIRHLAANLEEALSSEATPLIRPPQSARVKRASETSEAPTATESNTTPSERSEYDPRERSLLRFPQLYFLIGGLAAACFAVVIALRTPEPTKQNHPAPVTRVALPLSPSLVMEAEEPVVEKTTTSENASASASVADTPPSEQKSAFDLKASGLLEQPLLRPKSWVMAGEFPSNGTPIPALPVFGMSYAETAAVPGMPVGPATVLDQTRIGNSDAILAQSRVAVSTRTSPARRNRVQTVSAPAKQDAATLLAVNEQPIVLSAFSVEARVSQGYSATTTLAGSRLRSPFSGPANTESYAYRAESDFLDADSHPLSTFSADVDTASYANVRRLLNQGVRPPVDAVRIEEMLNYFPYRYAAPAKGAPFAASIEVASAPWAPTHRLVRIGLKAREVATAERGPANLVFLVDVSGSMYSPDKLPLVKDSMRQLLSRLRADDRVAIVTYAGASGLALASTPVSQKEEILAALEELTPGGGTNGSQGIELAYDIAGAHFDQNGINRVILCTDGDFNLGVTNEGGLVRLIEEKAKSGVFLTVLGFGMGNLKDSTMQQLADHGNGSYGYVDSEREAEKLLVEQVSGTLVTVAKDVKFQVEFNAAQVSRYRLIGYEKRSLKNEDFANDKVDAGDVGAGHTVTALYEVVPLTAAEAAKRAPEEEELRYVAFAGTTLTKKRTPSAVAHELLTVKVRYKEPSGFFSKKLEFPIVDRQATFAQASEDFKFAAAVAGFGMILRDSAYKGSTTLAEVSQWAEAGAAFDPGGYRAEFISLVAKARPLL